jgi:hypothetical protein
MPLAQPVLGGLEQGREDRRVVLGDQAAEMAGVVGIALEIGAVDLAAMRPTTRPARRGQEELHLDMAEQRVLAGVKASRRSTSRCGIYPCGRR